LDAWRSNVGEEVEVTDVARFEFGVWGGDDPVEDEFGSG
jgi:hypothetical protein